MPMTGNDFKLSGTIDIFPRKLGGNATAISDRILLSKAAVSRQFRKNLQTHAFGDWKLVRIKGTGKSMHDRMPLGQNKEEQV